MPAAKLRKPLSTEELPHRAQMLVADQSPRLRHELRTAPTPCWVTSRREAGALAARAVRILVSASVPITRLPTPGCRTSPAAAMPAAGEKALGKRIARGRHRDAAASRTIT